MASDLNSISLSNLKKILIYITIHSLIPLLQSLSLRYPTAFTLKDKNIFVIHSLGIDIYNPEFDYNSIQDLFSRDLYTNLIDSLGLIQSLNLFFRATF